MQNDTAAAERAGETRGAGGVCGSLVRIQSGSCPLSTWLRGVNRTTLWRTHAEELVAKEQQFDDAISHWGWSKLVNGIPDESYWSTLAQKHGHQITGTLTTYMEAGDPKTGHSKLFTEADVPRLWQQPAPSFFARKFKPTPAIDKALAERIVAARRHDDGRPAGSGSGSKGATSAKKAFAKADKATKLAGPAAGLLS